MNMTMEWYQVAGIHIGQSMMNKMIVDQSTTIITQAATMMKNKKMMMPYGNLWLALLVT